MPSQVQLVAGPARCGKTQYLLDQYLEQLYGSDSLPRTTRIGSTCWLAPNQSTVTQLKDQLLQSSGRALLQPNLFTFANFAESIIERSASRVRSITSLQKRRLLQSVIQSALKKRQLEHFALVATTPGFVTQVDEFIAELKRADTWPEAFEQWCQGRPRGDRRNRELSLLYSAYQSELHRGELYDSEGRFWAAREMLAASVSKQVNSLPPIYDLVVVNGFNDFTTAQYDILRLLGECSARLMLGLTTEQEAAGDSQLLFAKTTQTLARLREIFPHVEVEQLVASSSGVGSLDEFQQQIFREPESCQPEDAPYSSVEILAAQSERGEIEALAERIKQLLLDGQTQPADIVVVSRSSEAAALMAAIFPDYGIPYYSEQRPRLESEPLVRALAALLRLAQEDWPFQTLLEVINNRLFTRFDEWADEPSSFATQPRVAVEYCLRSAQLPSGKAPLLEQLEYRLSVANVSGRSHDNQRTDQIAVSLGVLQQLDQLLSALPAEANIQEWIQALEHLLSQLGALSSAEKPSRSLTAWKLLRAQLRAIENIDRWSQVDHSLSLANLQEMVASIAREQRVTAQHDEIGRVRILSAESARKLSVKHLFLAGLNEQAFSSGAAANQPAAAEDSPSPDELLSEDSPDAPTKTAEANLPHSDAMLLLYELATRPTESLTLSYPALDSKGQPLSPSPLLTDLERSVGEGRVPRRTLSLGQLVDAEATPCSSGSFRRQAVERALVGKEQWLAGMVSQPSFVRTGSSILSGIDCVAARSTRDVFGSYEGLLLSDLAREALARRFDGEHLWSPSQLEGYAACPFRFFSEQLLHLEPLNELTLSNDARRRGSLLHQVLATIHEELSREPLDEATADLDSQDLIDRFLAALDATVKANPLRGIEQSLREIERREIEAWVPSYAEQEISYRSQWKHLDEPPRPAHFEVRFGPESRSSAGEAADRASTPLPFELDLGDERIRLTGQIDRVDIGRVGGVMVFNIIDYKSGKAVKLKLDKVCSGHQLQLPLYALAAEQLLLAEQEAVALATGYWNIQGKGFESKKGGSLHLRELADQALRTSADWQQLQPEIMTRVQQLIGGMRDGQFPVHNQDENCTRSCSLSTVCRVAQIRSLEKVWPPEEVTLEPNTEGTPSGK